MRIEVPEYNTFVEFPDDTPPAKIQAILRVNFPPQDKGEDVPTGHDWTQPYESRPVPVQLLDFLTGHAPDLKDQPEVSFTPEGKMVTPYGTKVEKPSSMWPMPITEGLQYKDVEPLGQMESAEVPLLQSPEMALAAGAIKFLKSTGSVASRVLAGGREATEWSTGGLSEVPAMAVKGTKGAFKEIASQIPESAEKVQFVKDVTAEAKSTGKSVDEVATAKVEGQVTEPVITLKSVVTKIDDPAERKAFTQDVTAEAKATGQTVDEVVTAKIHEVPKPEAPEIIQPQGGKVTKAASDLNRSMVEAGIDELPVEDLARYTPITKAGQIEKITKLMDSDYEKVKNMAIGREPIPDDITPQALYNAVKKKAYAEGDTETLRGLVSSPVATERSILGQKLGAAGWDNNLDDPVKAMQDISKSRAEDIEKRTGKKPVADAKVTELETKLADAEKRIAEYESKQKVKGFDASLKDKAPRGAYGSRNKLVTKSDYDAAKAALKERLATQLSSGIDPANLADMTKIGMYHLEAGARDFAVWSKSIVDDVGKWAEPHLKGLYDQTIKAFHEAGVTKYSGKIGELVKDGKELSEVGNQVNELARHFVALGVKNRDELVTKVHEVLKQSMPDITRMETTHAIAGYGKFRPLSKDDISVKLRGYKGELQQVSKMEDILNKRPPLKTGVERRIPTDEERRLIQQVNELKKKYGITTTDKETQLKSALDSIKTRLNNQIKDLEAQISTKTKIVKEKTAPPTDKETEALKAKRDALKKQYDEIFAKPKKTVTDIKEAALKKRLEKQIEVLNKQITTREKATRQKYSTVPDKDTSALMDKVADLRKQRDAIFGGKTEQQKIAQAMAAVQKSISQYEKRIKSQDFSSLRKKGAQTTSPELDALRAERDALKEQFEHLKDLAKPKLTPEQIALKSLKRKMENETKKLTEKIEKGDFTKTKRETILDAEGLKLKNERDRIKDAYNAVAKGSGTVTKEEAQTLLDLSKDMKAKREVIEKGNYPDGSPESLEYGASRVAYERYIEQLKGENAPIKERLANRAQEFGTTFKTDKGLAVKDLLLDSLKTLTENSIAMVATLDNSFLGRQGLKVLMTHPTSWWGGAKNSFVDIYKTMKGQKAMDALWADVYSRKNFLNGNYEKAKIITKTEEQYPTSLPSKIPYIGRVFKASETAFEGSALRMRTDLFDLISEKATANGVNMADKTQLESVGKLINSLTARGQWGKKGEGTFVRMILWAPKMLKANIDVLTAHAGQGMSPFARKEAAMNLVKLVGETALVLGAANALKPGSVEFDSRSTDFGKIKVGDTRFDITGGMASIVTLASRLLTNSSKSASTGIIQDYGPGIAERSRFDALLDFLTNKTSPPASVVRDFLKGTDWKGAEFTTGGAVFQAFTPISLQKAIELKDNASADRVVGAIADVFGMGAQSFGASEATWRASQSKQMEAFHKQVGDANFKKANKEFNDTFNKWFEKDLKNNPEWKQATDEDKQQFLARQKEGLRNSIMGKYWIKGKQ